MSVLAHVINSPSQSVSDTAFAELASIATRLHHLAICQLTLDTATKELSSVTSATPCELALAENLTQMVLSTTDIESEEIALEGYVGTTIATEGIRDVVRKVTEAIRVMIAKIMDLYKRVKLWMDREIPKTRRAIESMRERVGRMAGRTAKEDRTYLNGEIDFLQVAGKKASGKYIRMAPEVHARLSEGILSVLPKIAKESLESYERMLDGLTANSTERQVILQYLQVDKTLEDILKFSGLGAIENNRNTGDERWKGYRVEDMRLFNSQSLFIIEPDVSNSSARDKLKTLGRSRSAMGVTNPKKASLAIERGSVTTLSTNDISDGLDYLLDIVDDIARYKEHSNTKRLDSTVKGVNKAIATFNKEIMDEDDVNPFIRTNRSVIAGGAVGLINSATVFPTEFVKYLMRLIRTYLIVYGRMLSNY